MDIRDSLFFRSVEIDRRAVDEKSRSVELSFSSETPVKRYFGSEILLHSAESADLSRLRTFGAALLNHNPNVIVGRVENPRIQDRRGKARIVFDDDEDGNRALAKVRSGSLRGVSVGYIVNKYLKLTDGEEWGGFKGPAYIATEWTPYEVSVTSLPADASVGIGRTLTRSLDGITIETISMKGSTMNQRIEAQRIADAIRSALGKSDGPVTPEQFAEIQDRASVISPEAELEVSRMFRVGRTESEMLNYLLDLRFGPLDAQAYGSTKQQSKKVDDETKAKLIRSIKHPAAFPAETIGGQGSTRQECSCSGSCRTQDNSHMDKEELRAKLVRSFKSPRHPW